LAEGEFVSVLSQRQMYEYQIAEEREELAQYPEEEAEELALIYHARGIPVARAREMARAVFRDHENALHALSIEELGVNPSELGSPWAAGLYSFVSFTCGALVPLLPHVIRPGSVGVAETLATSAVGLFSVGAAISLFSGRNALLGGARMLLIGCGAGLVTYLLGRALGVGLA
jgi:VIT1/CCC1 family predicted Fe2+/Mn2+ transporter